MSHLTPQNSLSRPRLIQTFPPPPQSDADSHSLQKKPLAGTHSPEIELQAIAAVPNAGFFANLAVRAEANALIDLCVAKNGSYRALTTDAGTQANTIKTNWMAANFTGSRAAAGIDFATNFNKGPYGGPNKLLIDDRTTYINQFEAAGGLGYN